jgi:2-polyprenyl-3-methyl-5-hydroxy-6-metoxy-1,4-benzoquinol methylase
MDLSIRSTLPEALDGDGVDLADYQRCLADLAVVNRVTFTHRPTLRWLARATKALPAGAKFSVLDVGFGDGDLLREIARWADRRGLKAQLTGIDLNPRSATAARGATPPEMDIEYRTGDVFSYRPDEPVDFIVSTQFAHHLSDNEIVEFLTWLDANSASGWHIADLHRHPLPYYGFPILARLMRWHRIIRSDGAISIARAFRRADWRAFLDKADLRAEISWYGFRFCVRRIKEG